MQRDEMDTWMAGRLPSGPLQDAMEDLLGDGIPIDDAEVDAVVARIQARIGGHTRRRRPPVRALALAAAAVIAVGLGAWSLGGERDLPASWEVRPHAAELDAVRPAAAAPDPGGQALAWVQAGRSDDAVLLYRLLLAQRPTGPDAARWQHGLIGALRASGDEAAAFAATLELLDRYGPGTAWATRHGEDEVRTWLEADLRAAAVLAHQRAQRSGDPELLEQAGVAYELYLADLADPEREVDMRYAYGEMLYKGERYDEAWEQYRAVATDHPDSARARFCAEAAIFAAEALAKVDDGDPVWRERMITSLDDYVQAWPDDDKAVAMRYRAAYAVYEEAPGEALDRLEALVQLAPDTREGLYAANLAVDALVMEDEPGRASELVLEWLELGLGTEADQDALDELVQLGGQAAHEATRRAVRAGADPDEAWAAYRGAWPDGPAPPDPARE